MEARYEITVSRSTPSIAEAHALAERVAVLGFVGRIQRVTRWPRRRVIIDLVGPVRPQ